MKIPQYQLPLLALILTCVAAPAWEVPGSVLRPGQRQLFLDDFIIGDIHQVTRVIHTPKKYGGNPVIRPDVPTDGSFIEMPSPPSWDEKEQVWKAWYWATGEGEESGCGFARSKDGLTWEKPNLGLVEKRGHRNNNLVTVIGAPEAFVQNVLIDPSAPPASRYKGLTGPGDRRPLVSADGFTFTLTETLPIPSQDTSHLTWDDIQKQYLLTVKHNGPFGRSVFLSVSKNFETWTDPVLIYHADLLDQELGERHIREIEANPRMWRPTINTHSEYNTEIYNMPIFVYEGLYIGLPTYFESSGRVPLPIGNQDGTNSVKLTCSRDLRAWTRVGDRRHFIPIAEMGSDGTDTGQVLAAAQPILKDDELWFYYTGIDVRYRPFTKQKRGEYHGGVHLAKLRRDGFVSLRAGAESGFVDTRPMQIEGAKLYINAHAIGRVRAEITDPQGRAALPGWGVEDCATVTGDVCRAELRWNGHSLKELGAQKVRIRFHLTDADLYSFWVEL